MQNKFLIKTSVGLFLGLGIIFIPFPYQLFSFQYSLIQNTLGKFLWYLVTTFFSFDYVVPEIQSDSILMYALFAFLLLLSFLTSIFIPKKSSQLIASKYFHFLLYFYLSLHLLKYGFNKFFLGQFYTPEPNILATPLGDLDQDILYWSIIGINTKYQLFLGIAEIISGILLLFEKTRKTGLYISLGILINIVAINFMYDISVKLFSSFLTLICLYLLYPDLKKYSLHLSDLKIKISHKKALLATSIIGIIILECIYPYIGNKEKNNLFSGAYQVTNSNQIKKVFFHKDEYIIFQTATDSMVDYKFTINEKRKEITLIDYNLKKEVLRYNQSKNKIYLFNKNKTIECIKTKGNTNALRSNFHWTVESVK